MIDKSVTERAHHNLTKLGLKVVRKDVILPIKEIGEIETIRDTRKQSISLRLWRKGLDLLGIKEGIIVYSKDGKIGSIVSITDSINIMWFPYKEGNEITYIDSRSYSFMDLKKNKIKWK